MSKITINRAPVRSIPAGAAGWGKAGELDAAAIMKLAKR